MILSLENFGMRQFHDEPERKINEISEAKVEHVGAIPPARDAPLWSIYAWLLPISHRQC